MEIKPQKLDFLNSGDSKKYFGWFDGATKISNPGNMGTGGLIKDSSGKIICSFSQPLGWGTNNIAEWTALYHLLLAAKRENIFNLTVYGDSKLVIYGVSGLWKVKMPHLREIYYKCRLILQDFNLVEFIWIPRELNREADLLSKV